MGIDYEKLGALGVDLVTAAGLRSKGGVNRIADFIIKAIGPDDRVVDWEAFRREREQKILRGY